MKKLGVAVSARTHRARALITLCLVLAVSACGEDTITGDRVINAPALPGMMPAEPDAGPLDMREPPCREAETSEPLPARTAAMGEDKLGTNEGVHVSELFNMFKTNCGDCHVTPASLGQFSMTLGDFVSKDEFLTAKINKTIQRVRSDNPDLVMPKNGPLLKDRAPDHPLRRFADLLEQWLREGRPLTFYPTGSTKSASTAGGSYRLQKGVGDKLTNLGNCVAVGRAQALKMDDPQMAEARALDDKFAAMRSFSDLPKSLRETDLTTFDSAELTKRRIFNYAPAYTLWADNAKKIRMIRVPMGESVKFDKDAQSFEIPENTRFYKTFLKKVKDLEGREGYRKIETRIIITRHASEDAEGKPVQNAVFGTYQWNEDESEATLVDTPYRDDEGFQDRVFPIVIDEQLDDKILRSNPKDARAARLEKGSMRSYAIPGFDRCVQCHMGAPGKDFALGFTPLQIWRRPLGEGGVFEAPGRDELNQLERLINYGLITGIASASEIVPLEDAQGERKPRNEHELNAQGYMLGNCAHCHNPNGFPSQKEQVMKEDLNFFPSDKGGIFQFPLERTSRRTFRGAGQDIKVPYVTPSLFDLSPPQLQYGLKQLLPGESTLYPTTLLNPPSKWIAIDRPPGPSDGAWLWKGKDISPVFVQFGSDPYNHDFSFEFLVGKGGARPLYAPWRSLIYRNVDAPFSYQEAGTVFPHMPMHTAGYDCRARRLLGKWMVSIPARWKSDGRMSPFSWTEKDLPPGPRRMSETAVFDEGLQDSEEQPFTEVLPDDTGYLGAFLNAEARLSKFLGSERFADCPDAKLDILDPVVAAKGNTLPAGLKVALPGPQGAPSEESYEVLAPARPHYFQTDLRLSKRWVLRRGDWYQSLVEGNDAYAIEDERKRAFKQVRDTVLDIKIDDAWRGFATGKVPFGLWDEKNPNKSTCEPEFEKRNIPMVSHFEGENRPAWMDRLPDTQPGSQGYAPNARVFMTSPGEHVFDLICSKCHGSKGNGDSALASTMADLTGGLTRVANLRDGIFGPVMSPGANRAIPKLGFGLIKDPAEREDWAARYVAWMGLGGTRAYIPEAVVGALRRFTVLGQLSALQNAADSTDKAAAGNMLKVARDFCMVLAGGAAAFDMSTGRLSHELGKDPSRPGFVGNDGDSPPKPYYSVASEGLIVSNGHAELWTRLCSYRNPMPVRILSYRRNGIFVGNGSYYRRGEYPADASVGAGGQTAPHLTADNLEPWCVERAVDAAYTRELQGKTLPYCPEGIPTQDYKSQEQDVVRWAMRGAANAGISVFLFFDDMNRKISQGQLSPRNVAYDRCQDFIGTK